MIRTFELVPGKYDGVKSFYKKAFVIENTDTNERILKSYETRVAKITGDGEFVRLWGDYSATTMRHVNAFIDLYHVPGGGKKWWLALPVKRG